MYAMVIASTNAEIAEDPAQKLMNRPTEMTVVLARMVPTVSPMRSSVTSSLKIVLRNSRTSCWIFSIASGPKSQRVT